jgi:hypothetical protein
MRKSIQILSFILLVFMSTTVYSQSVFFQWGKQFGSSQYDGVDNVKLDKQGNVYVVGQYQGTMDADPGIGVYNITQVSSTEGALFIVKLSPAGNFIWAKSIDYATASSQTGKYLLDIDSVGNVYVGGRSWSAGTALDINPGTGVFNITDQEFIFKLTTNGDFVWGKGVGGTTNGTYLNDISVSKNGDVSVVGYFSGTVDFDSGVGVANLTAYGSSDVFISHYNNAGSFIWAKKMGGINEDIGLAIATDANNNIYTTGKFSGVAYFNPSSTNATHATSSASDIDIFISKLDVNGNFQWAKNKGGSTIDVGNFIEVDNNSNVIVGGTFAGGGTVAVNFNPTGTDGNLSPGVANSFILKLNSVGNFIWVKQTVTLQGIESDLNQNVYCTGIFTSNYDFDTGPGTFYLNPAGGIDSYLLKLNSVGDFQYAMLIGSSNGLEFSSTVRVDSTGNVFSTGKFDNITDLNPGAGVASFSSNGSYDGFLLKLTNCIYDAPNICLVTVDSLALNNVIYWDKSVYPLADTFIVYRYDAFAMTYKRIGAKSINQPNFLIDTARTIGGPNGGDPQYSSSRYKLAIRGNCGGMGTKGLYHESIFIQQNNQNFSWNAYGIEGQSSPATGYQFMRDNTNIGTWQVLVNTGGLSTTDPNYASYPNGNWRVDALGFSCNPTAKLSPNAAVNKSKSNVKNNFVITSASELELKENIFLSPNPAKTELMVTFSNHQQIKTEFVITDVLGKVVLKMETLENEKIVIPLFEMSSGVYFLKIKQGKLQSVKKFVKE